ncbi:hypothetical protein ACSNOH_26755 [Streptomyces sp. URMC 127]|uniref:hypothetical protein n=1 Tax=Streptomyces sp. URMC 127 TaxID=3423402 RepID=UPI003F1AB7C2
MLAQLPLPHLLLMAAFSTVVFCCAMDRWTKTHKLTAVLFVLCIGGCLGMVAVGRLQYQHWNARQMLVLYSFALTGLTVGLFPSRKLFMKYGDEWRRGVKRDTYEYPARYQAALYVSVIVMCFLAFVLST